MNVADAILQEIEPYLSAAGTLWVAYSGGMDSTVLLHALHTHIENRPIKVLHVNHQLSARADAWQQHCEAFAARLGYQVISEKVAVENRGQGLESAAREERYRVFERTLADKDLLLCAHHADDQAETLLYRLSRGTGLKGLAGMTVARALGAGILLRPMLSLSRQHIHQYATHHELQWIEDDSNLDIRYDRNYLRHTIVSELRRRWPAVSQKMQESAHWLAEADQLLHEYALQDLRNCDMRRERLGQSLDLRKFTRLSVVRQKHVIRAWAHHWGYSAPDAKHLGEVQKLIEAQEDAQPCVNWGQCELRRFRQRMYLLPRLTPLTPTKLTWSGLSPLLLPDGSTLYAPSLVGSYHFHVQYREGGERCKPSTRRHSQSLKKLLQEFALEPWLRDRIPLVFCGEQVVAVGDLFVCEYSNGPEFTGRFAWRYPHAKQSCDDEAEP